MQCWTTFNFQAIQQKYLELHHDMSRMHEKEVWRDVKASCWLVVVKAVPSFMLPPSVSLSLSLLHPFRSSLFPLSLDLLGEPVTETTCLARHHGNHSHELTYIRTS